MMLSKILKIVEGSTIDEWTRVGASHRSIIHSWYPEGTNTDACGKTFFSYVPIFHSFLDVFMPDVDISLAYGANDGRWLCDENVPEQWVKDSEITKVEIAVVDLRYRGQTVSTWDFADVGNLCLLMPIPSRDGRKFVLPKADVAFSKLMFDLYTRSVEQTEDDFASALATSKIKIV